MNIREFIYHQYLAELGYIDPVVCSSDPDHGQLFAKIEDEEENFYLYCLACNYRLHPGSEFSNIIKKKVKKIMKETLDDHLE